MKKTNSIKKPKSMKKPTSYRPKVNKALKSYIKTFVKKQKK